MEITRGAIVIAAGPGEYAGKPRPFLVIQSDTFNPTHGSVTLCPVTSVVQGWSLLRVPVSAEPDTGLGHASEVQIDKVQTLRRGRITEVVGHAAEATMELVDQALRRWLQL